MSSGERMPGDDPRDHTNAHHWHKTHSLDGCPECYAESRFDRYGYLIDSERALWTPYDPMIHSRRSPLQPWLERVK